MVKWLAILLPVAVVALWLGARLAGGPVGFVPGGAFSAELDPDPDPDWSFAADLDSVDVQIDSDPPRTVRTGIVVFEGVPYLPVTYAPLKRWDAVVAKAPRVVLRAGGRHFARVAVPVTDAARRQTLVEAGQAKYGPPFHGSWTSGITEYFRLDPLPAD